MRVIKFRGKVKWNGNHFFSGQTIVGAYRYDHLKERHLIWVYEEDDWGNVVTNREIEVILETIGQFTGRIDKNGIEIYEGDKVIVNCDDEEFGIVVWDNEESEYEIDSDGCRLKLGCFYSRNLEVIGNIHDNPELV